MHDIVIKGAEVADDYRLVAALPTLECLREAGARLVLCSHLGRPKGEVKAELTLRPVAKRLGQLLGCEVAFSPDCVGEEAEAASHALGEGELLLLENLRFHAGEKKNDPDFALALSRLGDCLVNDAFGVCHRAHASVVGVSAHLPAACGKLIQREVEVLGPLRDGTATRPIVVVLGGAKLGTKIPVLDALIEKVDCILIGGGMAYTFFKARERPIGDSRFDADIVEQARQILDKARERSRTTGQELVLPRTGALALSGPLPLPSPSLPRRRRRDRSCRRADRRHEA